MTKALFFGLSLTVAAAALAAELENHDVAPQAVLDWIDACEREMDVIHGFVLLRHGKVVAEGSWKPFDTLENPHALYSHSKSFTSTAIGILADEGKVDLDERVATVFPDKIPSCPSDNLRQLRVRDLLTMNVGATHTDAENDDVDGDWERAFLGNRIETEPGLAFRYDSGATYMLSAIVQRKSGQGLMEFLKGRLFDKIGIRRAWSTTSPSGVACGGWGMYMTTREMALFGQLLLQKGVWNGERIVSEQWLALATAMQTKSGPIVIAGQDGGDWQRGYGFQFWRCKHGFFRADGANGQFTIVMPQYDAVLSIAAGEVKDTQKELDLVWERLLPGFKDVLTADESAVRETLRIRCANLCLPPVSGSRQGDGPICGRTLRLKPNPRGVKTVRLDAAADGWTCTFETESGTFAVPVGYGCWKIGEMAFDACSHEPLGRIVGKQATAASAAMQSDGTLRLRLMLLSGPQRVDLEFRTDGGSVGVAGAVKGICGCELEQEDI